MWSARLLNGVPGLYDFRYLNNFFTGKEDSVSYEPGPVGSLSPDKNEKLLKKSPKKTSARAY